MSERKKELINKAVDEAFKHYQERGYDGHKTQPQIIAESKQFAEKLAETKMHESRGFDYIASIATFLACESRGCPINLRMAKETSKLKIKTVDLQKARKITGIEPKLTSEDWIDGVVRTLKNKHIISEKQESKIIEKTVSEIPKIQKVFSPRYRTIVAAYNALKDSDIKITHHEMHNIFNVSEALFQKKPPKSYYDKISKKVTRLLRKTPETLYQPKDLVEILGLDIKPGVLGQILSYRTEKLGLLNLENYFGFSNICGSGHCSSYWCEREGDWKKCRTGEKNTKLKFYSKS